jgi:hypothetical protein
VSQFFAATNFEKAPPIKIRALAHLNALESIAQGEE